MSVVSLLLGEVVGLAFSVVVVAPAVGLPLQSMPSFGRYAARVVSSEVRPSVKVLAEEQQEICTTLEGAVTAAMMGPVTPEEMVPVKAVTRSTSTRYLAASTPTVGWP